MQAAYVEPAAPVMPPKSEVPSADEESPTNDGEPALPEGDLAAPPEPSVPESAPTTLPAPTEPAKTMPSGTTPPPAEESTQPDTPMPGKQPAREASEPEPQPLETSVENLFDEAAVQRRARERFAILQQSARYQTRIREEALRQQASRAAGLPRVIATADGTTPVEASPLPAPAPVEQSSSAPTTVTRTAHLQPEPDRREPDAARPPAGQRSRNPLR